ncbi:ubiquinol-cytochrome c reductase iron-sulfur subunit [Geobacter sp. SVR]|uniref:QcrA and Rieske domain-containing protein n=1 Tax=Geobacter sp. SVR TaxID=2495594 RepID=UPI00143F04B0|nr:ubiquinol-cytochrome c reductase iron-sulfur subunit [Geobacter sp. SVR]BCS55229.1 cytochrome b6 [Geobacter sp. SVR]GCF86028.1 cytochrome b6 [Geobacter sp. SVR]
MDTSRRNVLLAALGALMTAAAGSVFYPLFRYLAPASTAVTKKKVTLQLKEIPEGGAKFFEFEGLAAVLVKQKGGGVAAFSAVCTHLGCIVQWQQGQNQFLCPCHGGQFSSEGAVLGGPPPKPLAKLPFTVNGDSVTIG